MKRKFAIVLGIFLVQLIAAAICGPYSCQWGNGYYFFIGLASLATIVVLMLIQKQWGLIKRLGYAVLFSFLFFVVWIAGFVAGDFSILCRLF